MNTEVLNNNDLIKDVFLNEISKPVESLLNRNRDLYFLQIKHCFNASGINSFPTTQTPFLDQLVSSKLRAKSTLDPSDILTKTTNALNLSQKMHYDRFREIRPRYFLNGPKLEKAIEPPRKMQQHGIEILDQCVQTARDEFDLNEKRLLKFLARIEYPYVNCNRSCQFEIQTTFKDCIFFCQNSYLKLLHEVRKG